MQIKKVLGWAVVVFLAWYLFTQPAAAGNAVHNLLGLLQQAGQFHRNLPELSVEDLGRRAHEADIAGSQPPG